MVFAPDEVAEDEVTGIDVVAKLMEVLWDATAQSWFASDSAGEMLLGQFDARQDVRFCAKLVELSATGLGQYRLGRDRRVCICALRYAAVAVHISNAWAPCKRNSRVDAVVH